MGEAHLDTDGGVRWFKGHGPAPVVGPCPHDDCDHKWTSSVIAYGPDFAHYELLECRTTKGEGCGCRGWYGEWPAGHTPRWRHPEAWLQVEHVR